MTADKLALWLTGLAIAAERIDYGPAANATAVYLAAQGKRSIAESRSPDGVPYAPLKVRKGKALWNRGLLAASISARAAAVPGGFAAEQTVGVAYGPPHQTGFTVPERRRRKPWVFNGAGGKTVFTRHIRAYRVPARPFLGVTPKMADRIADFAVDSVVKQLFGE